MKIEQINEYEKVIFLDNKEIISLCDNWIEILTHRVESGDGTILSYHVTASLPTYPFISFGVDLTTNYDCDAFEIDDEYGVEVFLDVDGRFTKKQYLSDEEKVKWKYEKNNYDWYLADASYNKIKKYIEYDSLD